MLYPHPGASLGMGEVVAAVGVTLAISAFAFQTRRARPWLWAGWLWFAVTLVPVIGLVHVGFQGIADRYTYLPSLGLSVALGFGAAECAERLRLPARARDALAAGGARRARLRDPAPGRLLARRLHAVRARARRHRRQLRDPRVPGERAGPRPGPAARGDRALPHGAAHPPGFPARPLRARGDVRGGGRNSDAINEYTAALHANPDFAEAHFNLANLLGQAGQLEQAEKHYRRALELEPDNTGAKQGLALVQKLRAGR